MSHLRGLDDHLDNYGDPDPDADSGDDWPTSPGSEPEEEGA